MSVSAVRAFLLKKSAREAVLTIALIVAVMASLTAFMNGVKSRSGALAETELEGGRALISGERPRRDEETVTGKGVPGPGGFRKMVFMPATLSTDGESRFVYVIAVDLSKVEGRLENGELAAGDGEAVAGQLLAEMRSIETGEYITVRAGGGRASFEVSGVISTGSQADANVLVPLGAVERFPENLEREVFFEREIGVEAENLGVKRSPEGEVVVMPRVKDFLRNVNGQMVSLLNAWSYLVFAVVGLVTGVSSVRLVRESEDEIRILRGVGSTKLTVFKNLSYTLAVIAAVGSALGIGFGIVGSQLVASVSKWMGVGEITPFLGMVSAAESFSLSFLFCMAGGFAGLFPTLEGGK